MVRYTVEVTRALHRRSDVEVHVACRPEAVPLFASFGLRDSQIHAIAALSTLRSSWQEVRGLGRALEGIDPCVIFGSKHLVPTRPTRAMSALTVHDMLPLDRPGDFGLLKRTFLPRQYRRSLEAADVLACVSAASRDRLIHHLPGVAGKAVVVPNAMTAALQGADAAPVEALADRRFALVVGDFSLRKNVAHVVRLWPRVVAADPDAVLALVGPEGWGRNQQVPELDELVRTGHIVRLGHIDDRQLRWAYEHARVLLCPSLLEGFGLPVIEAAAFGCPAIVSCDPALMEAAEGHGQPVSTDDPAGWVDRIVVALGSARGPRTPSAASRRTWDHVANDLCDAVARHREAART